MFKTVFIKQIFNSAGPKPDAQFAVLRRDETLPFAPSPGQEIFWPDGRPLKLAAVTWNIAESSFSCRVEDDYCDPFSIDGIDFDELVEETRQSGWKLVKIFEGRR